MCYFYKHYEKGDDNKNGKQFVDKILLKHYKSETRIQKTISKAVILN
jgi:hypothetical protein